MNAEERLKTKYFWIGFLIGVSFVLIIPVLFLDLYGHDKEFWKDKLGVICGWSDNAITCRRVLCGDQR